MNKWRWSDLEFVLAVARNGSAAAAARKLGVSHATVIRHVSRFESNWPEPIFEHRREGYRLTDKGQKFLEAAEFIDTTMDELERSAVFGDDSPTGVVRVTTTDSLFPILADELESFHGLFPDITLDLSMTNQRLDLFNRDADIAIRPSNGPPQELIGRRVGALELCIYNHCDLNDGESVSDLPWIGFSHPIAGSQAGEAIYEFIKDFRTVARADSFVGAMQLAEAKVGCTFLPGYLGDKSSQLNLLARNVLPMNIDIWLLTHTDVLRARRVRVCVDYLYEKLRHRFKAS